MIELKHIYNKLPQELCVYIQELHYSHYHYRFMKKNKKQIELKGLLSALNNIPIVDEDNTSKTERIKYVIQLSNCNCCVKHITHRPSLLEYYNGYVPEYDTKHISYYSCKCKCKYYMDTFCWIDNDEIVNCNNNNNNNNKRKRSYTWSG
jgi:hypothetical protein